MSKRTVVGTPTVLPKEEYERARQMQSRATSIGIPRMAPVPPDGAPPSDVGYQPPPTQPGASGRELQPYGRPVRQPDPRELALTGRESAQLVARQGLQRLQKNEMLALFHRVDTALAARPGRSVLFIAPNPGAGSSSLACGYSQVAVQASDRRVLLVDARHPGAHEELARATITDTILTGRSVTSTAQLLGGGLYHNLLMSYGSEERTASLLKEQRFWRSLTAEFDEVVIDTPAVTESQMGLVLASLVDGVVVVVEAEETLRSQVRQLVDDLRMFRANVLGTVLNKRRDYLPRWLHRRL